MRQTLQAKLGQHLSMTPQMQQAIRLLQLSSLELQQEIQQALDANLMLEQEYEEDSDQPLPEAQSDSDENSERELTLEQQSEIPDDLPTDSQWEDSFDIATPTPTAPASDEAFTQEYADESPLSLQAYLLEQLQLYRLSDSDRLIARRLSMRSTAMGYYHSH